MDMQKKVALTPIAGAVAAALCPAQQAVAQSDDFVLEEIIVTATKRARNIQAIPRLPAKPASPVAIGPAAS